MSQDLLIERLIIEEDRDEHIIKHEVSLAEVEQFIQRDYVFIQARNGRWKLLGTTKRRRYLAVIIGERKEAHTYGFITARPASRKERNFYKEITQTKKGVL